MRMIDSQIVIKDRAALIAAIERADCEWHLYEDDQSCCLACDGDEFGSFDALDTFAPHIKSGYIVALREYDSALFRYEFVHGTIQEQVPHWVPAP